MHLYLDGSSSLFIMEAFQQSFLITAKEINGRVFILVAAHALGSEQQFLAKMELLVKRKEGEVSLKLSFFNEYRYLNTNKFN